MIRILAVSPSPTPAGTPATPTGIAFVLLGGFVLAVILCLVVAARGRGQS